MRPESTTPRSALSSVPVVDALLRRSALPRAATVAIPGYHGPATLFAFPQLARDPLRFFTETRENFGDLAWIRIGAERIVLVSEPELIDKLLWGQHAKLHKDTITQRLRMVLGEGLLTAEGERWRTNRRRIAPSFQRSDLARYAVSMQECCDRGRAALDHETTVDLREVCSALTLDIVHRCLFGSDVAVPTERIGHALERMMASFLLELRSWRRFVPESFPLDTRTEASDALAIVDDVLMDIIRARRTASIPTNGHHLLDRLMQARDDDGTAFTDKELRDEAITIFIAGHETTALGLTYALTALSWNPAARDRLRAELAAHAVDGRVPLEIIRDLPYLRAVVLETLRLYPPAWGFGRQAIAPVEVGPHHVPEGCALFVIPWVLHRKPEVFPEPLAFRPERWLDGLEQRLPRGAFLPFGGGPRTCVGQHFAMLEMLIGLATLVPAVDLDVDPAHDFDLQATVTLRPGGPVPATVQLR